MSLVKLQATVVAAAVLLAFLLPGSANAGQAGWYWHGKPVVVGSRIYPPYPWGYPHLDLGWKYPMFGEWVDTPHHYYHSYRTYYYQRPPYWDCCW